MEIKGLDYFGNEIKLGDEVAFIQTGYSNFSSGIIIKITDYIVLINHDRNGVGKTETKQYHNQVIKKSKVNE